MLIYFRDGTTARKVVYQYTGAAMRGQATAYVVRNGSLVWVKRKNNCNCVACREVWEETKE